MEIDAEDNSMEWDIIVMEVDEDWEEDVDVAIAVDVDEVDDNDDDVLRRRSFVYPPAPLRQRHTCAPRFSDNLRKFQSFVVWGTFPTCLPECDENLRKF